MTTNTENEGTTEGTDDAKNEGSPGANDQKHEEGDGHKDAIRKLREENAKHRNRAKEAEKETSEYKNLAETALKKFEDLEKSFNQKISESEQKISEAQQKIELADKRIINEKLIAEAKGAGVLDVDVFLKIVDSSGLKISDDGTVSGVTELVKTLKESKPFLFDNRPVKSTTSSVRIPTPELKTKRDLTALRSTPEGEKQYQKEKKELIRGMKK